LWQICTDLCVGIVVEELEEIAEPDKRPKLAGMPNLESVIRNSQEFNLPKKNSTSEQKTTAKSNSTDDAKLSIDQAYEQALDSGFSGVILARHRGDTVLHEAAGFANKGQKILNTVDTVFDIGSITKQFTGALILSLQEAGLLKVGDTLKDHFANIPPDKADITIHQLLTHTAGFTGAGQSYEAALRKHILEPAQLHDSGYLLPDWSNHLLAIGYRDGERIEEMSSWAEDGPYWNLRGNGGLLATANDLLKWHYTLAGESVLTASSIETLQGRHVDQSLGSDETSDLEAFYGYGWVTQDTPSGVVHWHTGGNHAFYACIGRLTDEDSIVIGLANEGGEALDLLCKNLQTIMQHKV